MSAEILTTIASVVTVLLTLASGFAWVVSLVGKQIGNLDTKLSGEIRALGEKMERRFELVDRRFEDSDRRADERFARDERADERFARVDERFDRMDERFDRLERELTEVKISVARLEGP